jgi:hypothetical protein
MKFDLFGERRRSHWVKGGASKREGGRVISINLVRNAEFFIS